VVIELTQMEWLAARIIGTTRREVNRASGVIDRQLGKQDPIEIEVDGIAAEMAMHRMLNRYPVDVFDVRPRSGSADLDRVDVKSTRLPYGRLLATVKDNEDVDVYVLAVIRPPFIEMRGWAYAHELKRDENLTNLGHGPTYAMEQSHPSFRRFS
jgi:hypothetical protein